MTYKVFGGTLSLTQSINHCASKPRREALYYVLPVNRDSGREPYRTT